MEDSGSFNNYYSDGYDSDKDPEYKLESSVNQKKVRIKIRGKMIEIPTPISDPSSSSDSNDDEPLANFSKEQSIFEEGFGLIENNIRVLQNIVVSNGKNYRNSIDQEEIEKIDPEGKENVLPNKTEDEIKLDYIERDSSELDKEKTTVFSERADVSQTETLSDIRSEVKSREKEADMDHSPTKLSRIRQRHPETWACNVRKECFDRGKEYISVRNKLVPARKLETKKDCLDKCIYKCARKVSEGQRQQIFSNYYKLNAQEKKMFILNTTAMINPERRRKGKNMTNSRKSNSFKYFFTIENDKIQVCKLFYCSTLCISQKPVYTAHKNKTVSNTPRPSVQGKHKKKFTSEEDANLVKEHINMFPTVQSHYCRENTKKQYLDGDLSIRKMYELYINFIQEKGHAPVKYCIYRNIFCTQFNISFNKPKKDRCDLCAEIDIKGKERNISETLQSEYEKHLKEKQAMKEERKKDRENDIPVLCFDLENVLSCPKADIKNFFYKSKLSVYNMTAHLSVTKDVYCAVWSEALHGRTGNDIASAVYKILNSVLQAHPEFEELILWSDSCVPQNKNSLMSFAMAHILQKFPHIKRLCMKFSVPGHSCIQEVDAVHSTIERSLRKSEYFSPISLLRLLLKVNRRKPYKIMQMASHDFYDFHSYTTKMNYKEVPFSKIACLELSKSFFEIKYKTSFLDSQFVLGNLRPRRNIRVNNDSKHEEIIPVILKKHDGREMTLPQNKIDALRSMLKWMPEVDVQYYNNILKHNPTKKKKIS